MKKPDLPINETQRQNVLDELNIVYTPSEERFDRITRLAQRLFKVPVALISIVNNDTQWFKSCLGLNVSETGRDISFCGHAIHSNDPFIIEDTLVDENFSDNPLVTGEPHIRFYAGQPITFFNQKLGTLCIIDSKPRTMTHEEIDSLRGLAAWVEAELLTWRNTRNNYVEKVMNSTKRKALLDPVTGDLNEDGMDLILSSILHDTKEHERPVGVQVQLENFDALEPSLLESVKKALAGSIRIALKDRGLMGMNSSNSFLTIIENTDENNPEQILNDIEKSLATFRINLGDALFKPEISVSQVNFSG